MKVTRDVIYDLLPAYFAGEASGDTKTLIDEFFASDPEFGRMAERFRTLQQDLADSPSSDSDIDLEREAFHCARNRFRLLKIATMWAVAAAVAFLLVALTPNTPEGPTWWRPGVAVGFVSAVFAVVTWLRAGPKGARAEGAGDQVVMRALKRKRRSPRHI